MIRLSVILSICVGIAGCAADGSWGAAWPFVPAAGSGHEPGHWSFSWELSGERRIAPVQVFDDGHRTWLQMRPGQHLPVVFRGTPAGNQWVNPRREGDYLILDGVWPELHFRGGSLEARARRLTVRPDLEADTVVRNHSGEGGASALIGPGDETQAEVQALAVAEPESRHELAADAIQGVSGEGAAAAAAAASMPPASMASASSADTGVIALTQTSFVPLAGQPVPLVSQTLPVPVTPSFAITLQDATFRQALQRWAHLAQWTFASEHWDVDVDIPISAAATFDGSFETAVQSLLAATELTDRPLQPCFYSNHVLRVVPYAQSCDRSGGARAS